MNNNDNERVKIYNKGFEAGQKHQKPSTETIKEIELLKLSYKNMTEKFEEIKKDNKEDHEKIRVENEKGNNELKDLIKGLSNKVETALRDKADKSEVETAKEDIKSIKGDIRWVVYTVVGCVLVGIIAFVFFNK